MTTKAREQMSSTKSISTSEFIECSLTQALLDMKPEEQDFLFPLCPSSSLATHHPYKLVMDFNR